MEETSLQQKIRKQSDLIKQQVSKFLRSFDTKGLKYSNFLPYLQALNSVFDLNSCYGEDYFQFISKKQLLFLFSNNRILMKDICSKLKSLQPFIQNLKNHKIKERIEGICKICSHQIQSRNIQVAKSDIQDFGINHLKKMLKKMQEQSNTSIFTLEQDKHFFIQLNKVLTKKQQVLSIIDNHLEKYLQDIMKNLQQIKYLQDLKDTTFQLPQTVNWESKIKNQINSVLLNSFKGKVPPWIQKTFDEFIKLYIKFTRQLKQSVGCQTDPYIQQQVFQLRKTVQNFKDQQKLNFKINQDYKNIIQTISQQSKNLEIQNKILKDKIFQKDIYVNKYSINNSKQFRSLRNSSLQPIQQLQNIKQSTIINAKKSKFKSIGSKDLKPDVNYKNIEEEISQKLYQTKQDKQNKKNIYGQQIRKQVSVTEHIDSSVFQEKHRRKKQKKYTDIQYFRKLNTNQQNHGFLPSIKQAFKDKVENQVQNLKQIKKISILSDFSLKIPKEQNKLQISSDDRKSQISNSIIKIEENNENKILEKQMQVLNLSSSQREQRIKKYKETISDVQFQLQAKVQNIQALKKTYELKKKNSVMLTSTNNKFTGVFELEDKKKYQRNSLLQLNRTSKVKIGDKVQKVEESVQTDEINIVNFSLKNEDIQKGILKKQKISLIKKQEFKPDQNFKSIEVQTEKSHLQLFKAYQQNQNIAKIGDQYFQKIMKKLILHSENKANFNKSVQKKEKSTSKTKINNLSHSKTQKQSKKDHSQNKSKINYDQKQNSQQKQNLLKSHKKNKFSSQKFNERSLNQSIISSIKGKSQIKAHQSSIHQMIILENNTKRQVFTKKDFSLFISQQNSFKYQLNLMRKYHKSPFSKLTQEQTNYFTSIYGMIQIIKIQSPNVYNQILSFIIYPYQTVVNDFSILNIVKDMSLQGFLWYMGRIKHFHLKCPKRQSSKSICDHVQKFIEKIQTLFVQQSYESIVKESKSYSSKKIQQS